MRNITVECDGQQAIVRPATLDDGIALGKLHRGEPDEIRNDADYHALFTTLYIFIAPVTEFVGRQNPLTFSEFCQLDQVFVHDIMDAVRKANAHWFVDEDDAEKKA